MRNRLLIPSLVAFSSLALVALAGAASAGVAGADPRLEATPGAACMDLFDQSHHQHCWTGDKAQARDDHPAPEMIGHRHMHL